MNNTIVNYRKICNRCNMVQDGKRKSCSGCGISFVFGIPNSWESKPLTNQVANIKKKSYNKDEGEE